MSGASEPIVSLVRTTAFNDLLPLIALLPALVNLRTIVPVLPGASLMRPRASTVGLLALPLPLLAAEKWTTRTLSANRSMISTVASHSPGDSLVSTHVISVLTPLASHLKPTYLPPALL